MTEDSPDQDAKRARVLNQLEDALRAWIALEGSDGESPQLLGWAATAAVYLPGDEDAYYIITPDHQPTFWATGLFTEALNVSRKFDDD